MKVHTTYLPQHVQLLYAELLQQCAHTLPISRGVSITSKTVNQKKYWYLEVVVGSGKKQYSIGPDSKELRELITRQKTLYAEAAVEAKAREKLVAMLQSGGLYTPNRSDGRVIELLAQSGVFLSGGVLVGSHALTAYCGMLGVDWESKLIQTQDIDIASETSINVAIKSDAPDVKEVLLNSEMGFFEIPALNPKSPSTSFKVHGSYLSVDLLTPLRGRDDSRPVALQHFKSFAHPVRFLDFLLEDVQAAVLAFRSGILVNVPSPARFALHKLVTSQRRSAAQQTKSRKDIQQAQMLLQVLFEDRPGDVWLALEAVEAMPEKFKKQLITGIKQLDIDIQKQFPDI